MTSAAQPTPMPLAKPRAICGKIFVTGMQIQAEIGVYKHERGRAQPLVVDVELDVPIAGAEKLGETLNYEAILAAARDVAAQGHITLVETYAERVALACLADPRVTRVRVRVEKPLALAPDALAAGVEITLARG
jgi:dihydroneopterin aldolase